jgi:hypothetical protein
LLVDGNDAVVIAEFKKGDQPFGPGFPYLALVMRDHGVPGQGFADLGFASATTTSNCNDIQFWIDDFAVPLISGNITISDATP